VHELLLLAPVVFENDPIEHNAHDDELLLLL
jgi:hypothetical protein